MASVTEWEEWIWRLLEGGLEPPRGGDDDTALDPIEAVSALMDMTVMSSATADLLLIRIVATMTQRNTLSTLHSLLEYTADAEVGEKRRLMTSQANMLERAISAIESRNQDRDVPFASAAEARSVRETAMNLFPFLYQLAEPDGITALNRVVSAVDGSRSERTESARNAVFGALIDHVANINSRTPLSPQLISRLRDGPAFVKGT